MGSPTTTALRKDHLPLPGTAAPSGLTRGTSAGHTRRGHSPSWRANQALRAKTLPRGEWAGTCVGMERGSARSGALAAQRRAVPVASGPGRRGSCWRQRSAPGSMRRRSMACMRDATSEDLAESGVSMNVDHATLRAPGKRAVQEPRKRSQRSRKSRVLLGMGTRARVM